MKADDIFVPASVVASYTERQRQPGKSRAGSRNPDEKPKKGSGGQDRQKKRESRP